MLIHELHGDAAAERLTDDRRARDTQFVEQVAQPHRECAKRVVTARLVRPAVTEQVGRHDAVLLGQCGDHRPPGVRTSRHTVDQQDGLAAACIPVCDAVAVQFQVLDFSGHRFPLCRRLAHVSSGP